jgi:CBS domain-containing membrane protein
MSPDATDPTVAAERSADPFPPPEVVELEAHPAEAPPPPRRASHPPDAPAPLSMKGDLPTRKWPPEVLSDLMTRQLIAVDETESLGDLEGGMARFRFRHLPVVSAGRALVGLITRTDFLHASLGTMPNGKPTSEKIDATTTAGAIMRRNVVTAKMDTPVATAIRVMLSEKLGCLPVVHEDGTLVGIVTETDFTRLALELLERR